MSEPRELIKEAMHVTVLATELMQSRSRFVGPLGDAHPLYVQKARELGAYAATLAWEIARMKVGNVEGVGDSLSRVLRLLAADLGTEVSAFRADRAAAVEETEKTERMLAAEMRRVRQ